MIIELFFSLLIILLPPLVLVIIKNKIQSYPFAITLFLGFLTLFSAIFFKIIPFGWLKLFIILIISYLFTYKTIDFCPVYKKLPSKILVFLTISVFFLLLDNIYIFSRNGWSFDRDFLSRKETYFRPPLNNDIERHLIIVNSLIREKEETPFLPQSSYAYQIFWHHLASVLIAPFKKDINYKLVAGIVNATGFIFLFIFIWTLILFKPTLYSLTGFIILLIITFHTDLFHFVISSFLGKTGIEADGSFPPFFFRAFSSKLIALTAPQHAFFFIFFLAYINTRKFFQGRSSFIFLVFSFLASPLMFVIVTIPFMSVCFLLKNTKLSSVFFGLGVLLTSIVFHSLILRFNVFRLFFRKGYNQIGIFVDNISYWFLSPIIWIAILGIPGILLTFFIIEKIFIKKTFSFKNPYFVFISVLALVFYYIFDDVELRRHFSITASIFGPLLLVMLLPPMRKMKVTFFLCLFCSAILHFYYIYSYTMKPSFLDPKIAWEDYFKLNKIITSKFNDLPILAAVDPFGIGLEKPPVMEVTTSFSLPNHVLAHINVNEKQAASIIKSYLFGIYTLGIDLGYKAILWGPVEERVWGEKVYKRFIEKSELLAEEGAVKLYTLKDSYRSCVKSFNIECARLFMNNGWYYEAIEKYYYLIKESPSFSAYIELVQSLIYSGTLLQAINYINEAEKLYGVRKELYFYRGTIFFLLKNYKEAEKNLKFAIKLEPSFLDSYYNLSLVYIKRKEYEEAEKLMSQAVLLSPKSPIYNMTYAKILYMNRKFSSSSYYFIKAGNIFSEPQKKGEAYWGAALGFINQKNEKMAAKYYIKALENLPNSLKLKEEAKILIGKYGEF